MAKQKKKRTKKYQGADAATTRPTVTRVTAANRGKIGQWWFDRKKVMKPALIAALVVAAIVYLIVVFVQFATNA